jgi:signal transduction histidine kinase
VIYRNQYGPNSRGSVGLPYLEQETGQSHDVEKVIHDFRSSLNVIIGYSELMVDGVMGKMTEEQRITMKDILEKSRRLADMVNDLVLGQKRCGRNRHRV